MKRLILASFLAVVAFPQTASIYILEPADAKEGRRLFDKMEDAEHAFNVWKIREGKKLRGVDPEAKDEGLSELNYSPDFSAAVPKNGSATNLTVPNNMLWGDKGIIGSACFDQYGVITPCVAH